MRKCGTFRAVYSSSMRYGVSSVRKSGIAAWMIILNTAMSGRSARLILRLVLSFKCEKRNAETANAFVQDIANRVRNRVQISTDALGAYGEAIERAFGADVDYGQIVKVYVHDSAHHPERQYSARSFASAYRRPIAGNPEMELVSTSHVERLNATTRLHVKRLSRLTLAFSKKLDNFKAAVGLHFAYYNFVRRHNTLRCTPAMAAGIERDFWTVGDLLEATV